MNSHHDRSLFWKCLEGFLLLFTIAIAAGYGYIHDWGVYTMTTTLKAFNERVASGLAYNPEHWNITQYTADPKTPNPTGSSGFLQPLYILTNNGFVIERNQPINGLLDSSDFAHLEQFEKPQTLSTITNETWRVQSEPIIHNAVKKGIVVVSYYQPEQDRIASVDAKLAESIRLLTKNISFSGSDIDVSAIDIRNVHYDVSFEIVNTYNRVLLNNGRTPTYIDVSHIDTELSKVGETHMVTDSKTGELFLTVKKVIKDTNNTPVGLIISGMSTNAMYSVLWDYLVFATVIALVIVLPLSWYISRVTYKYAEAYHNRMVEEMNTRKPLTKIHFNRDTSTIEINEDSVDIAKDSNQYLVCSELFARPNEWWEGDEEKEGRIVYDAVNIINRKVKPYVHTRLIVVKDRMYRLNPELVQYVG